jgi:cytochrome c553
VGNPEETPMIRIPAARTRRPCWPVAARPCRPQAQDMLLARNLAATCANCHGTNGNARGDMKPLAGVSAGKIIAMVADYKSGEPARQPSCTRSPRATPTSRSSSSPPTLRPRQPKK